MHLAKHEMEVDRHHITALVQSEPHVNGHVKQAKLGKLAPNDDLVDFLSLQLDEQQASLQKYDGDSLLKIFDTGSATCLNSIKSRGNPLHKL